MKAEPKTDQKRRSHRWGQWAEVLGAGLLIAKGHRILARRYKSPVGEIDLIARRNRTVVFAEVKARVSIADAAQAISSHQRVRIVRAAEHWMAHNPQSDDTDFRFDVILIGRAFKIRHLKDAFQAEPVVRQ